MPNPPIICTEPNCGGVVKLKTKESKRYVKNRYHPQGILQSYWGRHTIEEYKCAKCGKKY